MKVVKLYNQEMADWVQENCQSFNIIETVLSPVTFKYVPYRVELNNEQDEILFILRWQ